MQIQKNFMTKVYNTNFNVNPQKELVFLKVLCVIRFIIRGLKERNESIRERYLNHNFNV